MREPNDWRLTNQEKYLKGATLVWHVYQAPRPDWDHDHCSFCWAKFMEQPLPETLQVGYSTPDNYYWVCKPCFEDFSDLFHWNVSSAT
jgi:hypothetical protein